MRTMFAGVLLLASVLATGARVESASKGAAARTHYASARPYRLAVLGVSSATVERELKLAKAWLNRTLAA